MTNIKDVAREAGVSVATVSRVINNSPKASKASIDAVSQAMKKLNYRPNASARALVNQRTGIIGVLVADVSDPFFGILVKTIDVIAQKNNKHVLICNGYHNASKEKEALELLINQRCDALVIHSKALSDKVLIDYANEAKTMVVINRYIPELKQRCIALDNFKGAYLATEHLILKGHKNIACIASNHAIEDANQRIEGYLSALSVHNIELSDDYIEYGSPDSEGGKQAMSALLSKSLTATAVVAYNDYMAAGAISVLEENLIKVPEQFSIVGFDDSLIAQFVRPQLTTIRYPIELMAQDAINLALQLIQDPYNHVEPKMYRPLLIQRTSVAKRALT